MNTHATKRFALLFCGILGAVLTTSCATSSAPVKEASPLTLLGTPWRLTQWGGEVVDNPPGERAAHFLLESSSTSLVGFAGCNRVFGQYALDGASLKFNGVGGTRMFCEARMDLERKFLAVFEQGTGWKIAGTTLQLLDDAGKIVATFNTP